MSRGWTITLVVVVALAASSAGFIYGRKRGVTEGAAFRVAGPLEPGKGPAPVIDPKVVVAAKIASAGAKPQKVG